MSALISYNPANQKEVGRVEISTPADVTKVVVKAKTAWKSWRTTSITQRTEYVRAFYKTLSQHQEELALLITKEMGKPISQSRDEVKSELGFIDWYVENAQIALSEQTLKETESATYKVLYEPWGVCASIAPWNFPISMVSSGIIQQVLAGNTVVFKPSEYTTLTQKRFIELMQESGFPEGVVQGVYGEAEVGKALIDSDVDLVWFTGSTAVGQEIYKKCGQKFIKGVMELGGNSPGIIFADCDLDTTVETLYWARFLACGQVCSAIKRLYVERSIFDDVVSRLKQLLATKKVGDPLTEVDFGPLVSKTQLDMLIAQVEDAKQKGAKVEIGGGQPEGKELAKGYYYQPTILTQVTKEMRVITEETFGPVLPIIPFDTEEEVINEANDTQYGLSAEVFTKDAAKAQRVASALETGMVGINTDALYYPFCPIGGYKKSGMGREYGVEGFRELTQIKYIATAK